MGIVLERLARQPASAREAFREIARPPEHLAPDTSRLLPDTQARPIAAARPGLPSAVLVDLLADENRQVVSAAAANPSLPADAMCALLP